MRIDNEKYKKEIRSGEEDNDSQNQNILHAHNRKVQAYVNICEIQNFSNFGF